MANTPGKMVHTRRPKSPVEVADVGQVRNALKGFAEGKTIGKACGDAKTSQSAFWRRVMNDPELKREFAGALIFKALDRTDQFSAAGNAAVLSAFAKLARDGAGSLSPSDWGDKVQVERRSLVIHCNLDFSQADSFDGIVVEAVEAVEGGGNRVGNCEPSSHLDAPKSSDEDT